MAELPYIRDLIKDCLERVSSRKPFINPESAQELLKLLRALNQEILTIDPAKIPSQTRADFHDFVPRLARAVSSGLMSTRIRETEKLLSDLQNVFSELPDDALLSAGQNTQPNLTVSGSPGATVVQMSGQSRLDNLTVITNHRDAGSTKLAEALEGFLRAVSEDIALGDPEKQRLSESVNFIAKQPLVPREDRAPRDVIEAGIEKIGKLAEVSAKVHQAWNDWSEAITEGISALIEKF